MSQFDEMDPFEERTRPDRNRRQRELTQRARSLGILLFMAISLYAWFLLATRPDTAIGAELAEGLVLAAPARSAVADYIRQHEAYPPDNAAAGLPSPGDLNNEYVASITVDRGFIRILFGGRSQIAGTTVTLIPDAVENGDVRWACDAPGIARSNLALACDI